MLNKIIFSVLALIIVFSLRAISVEAQGGLLDTVERGGLSEVGQYGYEQTGPPTKGLMEIVAGLIRIFLGFLGIIFFILFVWAGFQYMTAAGNEEKIKDANARMRNAIIGLVIILSSFAIVTFVIRSLAKAST